MSALLLRLALPSQLEDTALRGMLACSAGVAPWQQVQIAAEAEGAIGTHTRQPVDHARWHLLFPDKAAESSAAMQRCERQVHFAADAQVPMPFRDQRLAVRLPVPLQCLILRPGERALATMSDGVLWSVLETATQTIYRTAMALERAQDIDSVVARADGDGILDWVPLLHFLSQANGPRQFEAPLLRACFIIDDPNLHWTRYGFVDYREIAADAARENYHVAFATIPLDAWFTHRASAEIFRRHRQGLSLLVHGNNHGKEELARVPNPSAGAMLLRQSLDRIAALEASSHLEVSRVMVPPHGACSSDVLALLPQHGFEAACISAGSLKAHNPGQAWTRSLGLMPSEMVHGCPVLPRWAFASGTPAALRLAAYLGKALILRGHHQDLRHGLDVFRAAARSINSIGPVRWGSLGDLARLNYRSRREGCKLQVQPLGVCVDVSLPDGIHDVTIEGGAWAWQRDEARMNVAGQTHTLHLQRASSAPPQRLIGASPPRTRSSLVLRRLLTEARDRLQA
jgi:hypothetical protein